MTHGDIEDADITKVASFICDMTGIGVLIPDDGLEDYVRRVGHLPERTYGNTEIDSIRQNQPPESETAAGSKTGKGDDEIPDETMKKAGKRLGRGDSDGNTYHTAKAGKEGKEP